MAAESGQPANGLGVSILRQRLALMAPAGGTRWLANIDSAG